MSDTSFILQQETKWLLPDTKGTLDKDVSVSVHIHGEARSYSNVGLEQEYLQQTTNLNQLAD